MCLSNVIMFVVREVGWLGFTFARSNFATGLFGSSSSALSSASSAISVDPDARRAHPRW